MTHPELAHAPQTNGAAPPHLFFVAPAAATGVPVNFRLPHALACFADASRLAEARRRYERTTDPIHIIAASFGVRRDKLGAFARQLGWTRPPGAPRATSGTGTGQPQLAQGFDDAVAVQERILRAVDRQVRKIETRLRKPASEIEEKDARILGTLAKTMQTLMTLDKARDGARDGDAAKNETEPSDSELRAELARRIAAWAAEGDREGEESS